MTWRQSNPCSRPLRLHIDLAAIKANYLLAKDLAKKSKCWATVKTNAYGHGLNEVVNSLKDIADGFALIEIEQAIALRQAGVNNPILLLQGPYSLSDMRLVVEYQLIPVIHCKEQLEMLKFVRDEMIHVYIKINTGMNRLGFAQSEIAWLWQRLGELSVSEMTIMTHLADADNQRGVNWQLDRFRAMSAGWVGDTSIGNSAAIFHYPNAVGDWGRPGLMLYGSSPFAKESAKFLKLKTVMSLTSRLIAIQNIARGERVGYGGTFTAEANMRIGIVACGYGDGYPRHALTGTPISVGGHMTRTLGTVSMDSLVCDISNFPDVALGAHVTLWGNGPGGNLPIEQVATSAGTISYELMCAINPRVVREYSHL